MSRFVNPKRPTRENRFVTVAHVGDVPDGYGATVELPDDKELALYNVGGRFYAVENYCPHRGAALADGNLCDHTIECNLHGWLFDLRTGACLNNAGNDIETYEVMIEDDEIKIRI